MNNLKLQDRLYVYNSDKDIVEKIEKEGHFNFKKKTRKEQFLFALALGASNYNEEFKIEKRREWFFTKDLQPEDIAIVKACAIHVSGSTDILKDLAKVYKISEECAHIGFMVLQDMVNSLAFGSLEKQFEKDIMDLYKSIQ